MYTLKLSYFYLGLYMVVINDKLHNYESNIESVSSLNVNVQWIATHWERTCNKENPNHSLFKFVVHHNMAYSGSLWPVAMFVVYYKL